MRNLSHRATSLIVSFLFHRDPLLALQGDVPDFVEGSVVVEHTGFCCFRYIWVLEGELFIPENRAVVVVQNISYFDRKCVIH